MTLKQATTLNWVEWFDVQGTLLDGFRSGPEEVLLIDIGAGEGHYIHAFNEKFPDVAGRRILQDLPPVVAGVKNIPAKTELMGYDFFTPQPVKGRTCDSLPPIFIHHIVDDL